MLTITCKACGGFNSFEQPYPYHAGFGNQGFLYNDAGTLTLVWSSYHPAYESIVGRKHPWSLSESERSALERALRPSPAGDRWRFANPPRCLTCHEAIGQSIMGDISYLVYPGSVETEKQDAGNGFEAWLRVEAASG
jgi:hypothetical protein